MTAFSDTWLIWQKIPMNVDPTASVDLHFDFSASVEDAGAILNAAAGSALPRGAATLYRLVGGQWQMFHQGFTGE